ncbi:hypothetical protein JMN12_05165 [Capnocytophaga genosp. AHN8471]|nr:hypothetical protein [Capnocytophaga genosp. AHN8471]MBM0655957.1 hypothetical protein [Capnocytophaga genosp. AHN8471]
MDSNISLKEMRGKTAVNLFGKPTLAEVKVEFFKGDRLWGYLTQGLQRGKRFRLLRVVGVVFKKGNKGVFLFNNIA